MHIHQRRSSGPRCCELYIPSHPISTATTSWNTHEPWTLNPEPWLQMTFRWHGKYASLKASISINIFYKSSSRRSWEREKDILSTVLSLGLPANAFQIGIASQCTMWLSFSKSSSRDFRSFAPIWNALQIGIGSQCIAMLKLSDLQPGSPTHLLLEVGWVHNTLKTG